jgi:hypothetical protein
LTRYLETIAYPFREVKTIRFDRRYAIPRTAGAIIAEFLLLTAALRA